MIADAYYKTTALIALVAIWAPHVHAQPPDPALVQNPNAKPDDVWEAKVLTIDAAPEPVPALKYRLLPLSSENTPGDAAPMYLRLSHEIRDETFLPMTRDAPAWIDLPFETFPLGDAKNLAGSWTGRLKLIDMAARRSYCDWSYPVREQSREIIEILLPDAQELRSWSRLLALKARVEIREGRFDDALHTLQTGLAMGRHLGDGPFLINGLVGIASCQIMLDRVEEFVTQPGAPNLYWALSALPQPMISLRDAFELEQRLGENLVPELDQIADADAENRTPEAWNVLLASMFQNMQKLGRTVIADDTGNEPLKALLSMDLDAFRAKYRDEALAWAREANGLSEADAADLPESRLLAEYLLARYRSVRDTAFKAVYLPYVEGRPLFDAAETKITAEKSSVGTAFAQMLPALQSVSRADVRLARRIAALRVIEAIRMHAAAHDGALPKSLDEIKVVPVPLDPATNQPFSYEPDPNDAKSALLTTGRIDNQAKTEVAYQISVR